MCHIAPCPGPTALCLEVLTPSLVQIGWRGDESLKEYDAESNVQSKRFQFEIRSKKMRPRKHTLTTADDHDHALSLCSIETVDAAKLVASRPIVIRETFSERLRFHGLECGETYKFQVRIKDHLNSTFVSKWSETLMVKVPSLCTVDGVDGVNIDGDDSIDVERVNVSEFAMDR